MITTTMKATFTANRARRHRTRPSVHSHKGHAGHASWRYRRAEVECSSEEELTVSPLPPWTSTGGADAAIGAIGMGARAAGPGNDTGCHATL